MSLSEELRLHRWWVESWKALRGDVLNARAVRQCGDELEASPLWPVLQWEVKPLSDTVGPNTQLLGRVAMANLLDMMSRFAPRAFPTLVKMLGARVPSQVEFSQAGSLSKGFELVFADWNATLADGLEGVDPWGAPVIPQDGSAVRVPRLLIEHDAVAWDLQLDRDNAEGRRAQAAWILGYRDGVSDVAQVRLGIAAASRWAADPKLCTRLVRVGGRLEPGMLTRDQVAVAALAAVRLRRVMLQRGTSIPPASARAFDLNPALLQQALASLRSEPERGVATKSAAPEPVEPARPASAPSWLVAAQVWAGRESKRMKALLDVAERVPRAKLWPPLLAEIERVSKKTTLRPVEAGLIAVATLLDEVYRTAPSRFEEFLDWVEISPDEVVGHDDVGHLWSELDPVFSTWARELDPAFGSKSRNEIAVLSRYDILPWDESAKGDEVRRQKLIDERIDELGDPRCVPRDVRASVYWAATVARNDIAHRQPSSLRGRIKATELHSEVMALAALATLRFRTKLAEREKTDVSVASFPAVVVPPR